MVDNCLDCAKIGVTTECQYMEFPAGTHHYFDQKFCTFHYWLRFVRPKKGWEEYHKFVKTDSTSAGYNLTLPPDEVIKSEIGLVPPMSTPQGGSPQVPPANVGAGSQAGQAAPPPQ